MKTVAKRSGAILLALLVAITTLFAGSLSAFAAEPDSEAAIAYDGTEVNFIKADGSQFGMWSALEGTTFGLEGDDVTIHYETKNTTTYRGFHYGPIADVPQDENADVSGLVDVALEDGALDFTISKDFMGKAVPVAPIKNSYASSHGDPSWTSADQYYLAIPAATEMTVVNNVPMFNILSASLFGSTLTVTMKSAAYDWLYEGHSEEAEEATEDELIPIDPDTHVFNLELTDTSEPILLAFHSKSKDEYYNRLLVVDVENKTLTAEPYVEPVAAIDELTTEEAIAKADELATVDMVNSLIRAIKVQVRDENTDKYCAVAGAYYNALTADEKEELNDPGYFGDDTGDASLDDPRNADGIGEKELLVVSFGTSFNGSRVATVKAVEDALAAAYPDYSVRRAFTAQIIINHIQARDGEAIDNMQQALDRAVANGVKELVVQPTHLMHGAEYDEMCEALAAYEGKIEKIIISEPLLNNDADKKAVAKAVVDETVAMSDYDSLEAAEAAKTAFVYMGHGTSHEANVTYAEMQDVFTGLGYTNVFVGTVEGKPASTALPEVKKAVEAAGYTSVILRPLMVVAGDHANNDMAADEEGSWYYAFVNGGEFEVEGSDGPVDIGEGFGAENVTNQINGLGEIKGVQDLYVSHVKDAIPTFVNVDFTSQTAGGFLHAPQFDYAVASNEAEKFGYTDEVDGVSALDVLVAAHELTFGDEFTKETAEDYLKIKDNNVERQFGIDPVKGTMGDTFRGGFYVNHTFPVDVTEEGPDGGYMGTVVGTQEVVDGDLVEFFFYESEYMGDSYNWFLGEDGKYSREFTVEAGQDLDLTLNGFYAYYGYNFKDESEMIAFDSVFEIPDAQLYTVNLETGALTKIDGAITDEDGIATVNFPEKGTYTITAFGEDETGMVVPILTLTTIKVVKPAAPADITVTISEAGNVRMAQETVTVIDLNKDGTLDVNEALYAAHEKAYEGGAAAGYATAATQWGTSITKLWGDESGSYGYYNNNQMCMSLDDAVKAGDALVAWSYKDAAYYSDAYSYFDAAAYTAKQGMAANVTLTGSTGWDENWNPVFEPVKGATLTVTDSDLKALAADDYEIVDNKDGSYLVYVKKAGNYFVIATGDSPLLVPAVAKVTVEEMPALDHEALTITNNISMFKPATVAVSGTPGAYTIHLTMENMNLSKVFVGYNYDATDAAAITFTEVDGKGVADIPVSEIYKPIVLATQSANNGKWYNRTLTIDLDAKTAVFDPTEIPLDLFDDMTAEEAVAKAADLTSPELVDRLIAAIQVQARDENTDKYCTIAKAYYDALSDSNKEKLEDPGYFGDDTGDASLDDPRNGDEIGEKELLVVSFGTSFNGSRVATVKAVEDALAKAYPEYSVRRAFTAQIIINHIQARDGEKIDNMQQALDRAVANGVKELIVQPTHLMHGAEYDEMCEALKAYEGKIEKITVCEPLLNSDADKKAVAKAVVDETIAMSDYATLEAAEAAKTAIVYMGHGTSHEANVTYAEMQKIFSDLGYKNVFVGTVEGLPESTALPEVKKAVEAAGYTKVILRPLMVVAGDHANNDMAADEEGSWYYAFVNGGEFEVEGADKPVDIGAGFGKDNVTCQINGLGEIAAVQNLYVSHVEDIVGHKLTAVPAKAATYKAAGNIAYWVCERCGKYFADAEGKTEITKESTVIPMLKVVKGKTYKVSGQSYKVTKVATAKAQGTVTFTKAKNAKKVTVPATVKLADGKVYKVTQVGAKAFTAKKIRTVTIGKNVKKLAKNAFAKSKATKVILKTKLLKKAGVKGSLKSSKVKTVQVKVGKKAVNKKTVKAYKKIFTKKNAGKKVTVK